VQRKSSSGRCLWKALGAKAAGYNIRLPGRGRKPRRKCGKTAQPGARTGRKTWRKRGKNNRIPGASRRNEREDGHGRMKEEDGRKQKKKKKKKMQKNMMPMLMMKMTTATMRM